MPLAKSNCIEADDGITPWISIMHPNFGDIKM